MTVVIPTSREDLWLPLLQRLTELSPGWVVWKNAESAFTGTGDIDAAAPRTEWPTIERCFREWAAEYELGPVIVCRHIPDGFNLVAMPADSATLLEVGVKESKIWRGSTLFEYDDLVPLMSLDDRGFRRIRPGAEGVFKLMLNGTRWNGRPDTVGLTSKNIVPLLREDPEGAELAARIFGPAEGAVIEASRLVAEGGWSRGSMLAITGWALLRCFSQPGIVGRRLRFRLMAQKQCPVVTTLLRDQRRIPDDRAGWLRIAAETHTIYNHEVRQ